MLLAGPNARLRLWHITVYLEAFVGPGLCSKCLAPERLNLLSSAVLNYFSDIPIDTRNIYR